MFTILTIVALFALVALALYRRAFVAAALFALALGVTIGCRHPPPTRDVRPVARTLADMVCTALPEEPPPDTPAWQRFALAGARALLCDDQAVPVDAGQLEPDGAP